MGDKEDFSILQFLNDLSITPMQIPTLGIWQDTYLKSIIGHCCRGFCLFFPENNDLSTINSSTRPSVLPACVYPSAYFGLYAKPWKLPSQATPATIEAMIIDQKKPRAISAQGFEYPIWDYLWATGVVAGEEFGDIKEVPASITIDVRSRVLGSIGGEEAGDIEEVEGIIIGEICRAEIIRY